MKQHKEKKTKHSVFYNAIFPIMKLKMIGKEYSVSFVHSGILGGYWIYRLGEQLGFLYINLNNNFVLRFYGKGYEVRGDDNKTRDERFIKLLEKLFKKTNWKEHE